MSTPEKPENEQDRPRRRELIDEQLDRIGAMLDAAKERHARFDRDLRRHLDRLLAPPVVFRRH